LVNELTPFFFPRQLYFRHYRPLALDHACVTQSLSQKAAVDVS
jgi:hypothetical protein